MTARNAPESYWASYWATLCLASLGLAAIEAARHSYTACALWTLTGAGWGVQWALGSKGYAGRRPPVPPPRTMGWRAWAWIAFIVLMTAVTVVGDRLEGRPSWEAPFDAITGLWCALLVRAHYVDGAADRLGRAIVPISVLIAAAFAAVHVFHGPRATSNWIESLFDTLIVGAVVVFPLAFGIRRGLQYWRSPTGSL